MYENKLCLHYAGMHTLHSNNRQYNKGWHRRNQKKKYQVFLEKNVVSSITLVKDVAKAIYYKNIVY